MIDKRHTITSRTQPRVNIPTVARPVTLLQSVHPDPGSAPTSYTVLDVLSIDLKRVERKPNCSLSSDVKVE